MQQTCATLTVVDLAGSERIKKTKAEGLRLQEATNINKSLLTFGNVVQALAKKDNHVPFRDSTLTKLLEGSIGGNCRTSLLVCVNPHVSCWGESVGALEFATRAMRIETKLRKNVEEVTMTRAQLLAELENSFRDEAISQTTDQIMDLESRLKSTETTLKNKETESQGRLNRLEAAEQAMRQSSSEAERLKFRVRQLQSELESTQAELAETKDQLAKVSSEEEHQREQGEEALALLQEEQRGHHITKQELKSQRQQLSTTAATLGDQAQKLIEATRKCSDLETSIARAEEQSASLVNQLEVVQEQLDIAASDRTSLLARQGELKAEKLAAERLVRSRICNEVAPSRVS